VGERSFIDSVHRQIDAQWNLHKQSMTGVMGANGTPDYYYEVLNVEDHEKIATATWIEYKYVKYLPPKINLANRTKKYSLSALQNRWLDRAHHNKIRAAAVLGSLDGAIIFTNGSWNKVLDRDWAEEYGRVVRPIVVAQFAAGYTNCRVIE
jgi:hypothetical protein